MATNRKDVSEHYYSLEEYFALEHADDARYEYWDGEIFCMSGGTKEHGTVSSNVHYRLRRNLEGGPCFAFTADTAIRTPTLKPYRYPDASAGCGDLKYEKIRGVDALINPVLIVEVLSPTTSRRDRSDKFKAYQVIESFKEYLLISQDIPHVRHYVRQSDGEWTAEDVTDLNAVLKLDSIGCTLSMLDIYQDVTFKAA